MPVRSRRLFGPTTVAAATTATVYTVPAARTARFSLVQIALFGTVTTSVAFRVNSTTGNTIEVVYGQGFTFSQGILFGLVLDPGDFLAVTTPTGLSVVIAGFGSLLDGAPS